MHKTNRSTQQMPRTQESIRFGTEHRKPREIYQLDRHIERGLDASKTVANGRVVNATNKKWKKKERKNNKILASRMLQVIICLIIWQNNFNNLQMTFLVPSKILYGIPRKFLGCTTLAVSYTKALASMDARGPLAAFPIKISGHLTFFAIPRRILGSSRGERCS